MDSRIARTMSGSVGMAVGSCILGSGCLTGTSIVLAVVFTVTETGAGAAGVTTTADVGVLQVDSAGAPVQAIVTLAWSVAVPPVTESCRL